MSEHTPGPWTIEERFSSDYYTRGRKYYAVWISTYKVLDIPGPASEPTSLADARLIAAAPELVQAIEVAGRIVGQVLGSEFTTKFERDRALSRAFDALSGTYYRAIGQPLEWWESEPTTKGQVSV